ncbi:MAG: hypothetical protein RLZZ69_2815 [Cyanobacteriota bacterium]|jgi:hypothetical protein
MFERATAFSAIFIFIVFGMIGLKYLNFMEAKSQGDSISVTSSK